MVPVIVLELVPVLRWGMTVTMMVLMITDSNGDGSCHSYDYG